MAPDNTIGHVCHPDSSGQPGDRICPYHGNSLKQLDDQLKTRKEENAYPNSSFGCGLVFPAEQVLRISASAVAMAGNGRKQKNRRRSFIRIVPVFPIF